MSTGKIGEGVGMGTGLLADFMNAKGAVHAADVQAGAGRAAISTERANTEQAIQAMAGATQGQRGIGALAMYQIASMLGIDPRAAFPNAYTPNSGTGGGAGSRDPNAPTMSGGREITPGQGFVDGSASNSRFGGFGRDPLQVFQNYTFMPYTLQGNDELMGGVPMPSAPGEEFGRFNRPYTMQDLIWDPSYQFRLDQNLRGIENSAAARGMQLSGSTLKDLSRFSQDFASQEYANAYGRRQLEDQNLYARLSDLARTGNAASANLGNNAATLISGFGKDASTSLQSIGDALAAGQMGASTAISTGIRRSGQETMQMMGGGGGSGGAPSGGGGSTMPSNWDKSFGGGIDYGGSVGSGMSGMNFGGG